MGSNAQSLMLLRHALHAMSLAACAILAAVVMLATAAPLSAQTRIAFWNVENYFDTDDDPLTNDDEFTPDGSRHWTWRRFAQKRDGIAKTLMAMNAPVVVGLAEVENRKALDELRLGSPLRKLRYEAVHYDSPDPRGIDCALLYRADSATLTESRAISVSDSDFRKRDILLAGLALRGGDTLYCLVNHWSSRLGGAAAAQRRAEIALTMARLMDSLAAAHPAALVLAMGDFNSTPDELDALLQGSRLRSLMDTIAAGRGTYCYQGVWQLIDHMMATITPRFERLHAAIYEADHLLEDDRRHLTRKPFRTYLGPRYHGGLSDHLPIYLDWAR